MKFIGIIPARYASTRFPGKPLATICGKPMIQRVYEQASKVLNTVVVATDDVRIFNAVNGFNGRVVMTSPTHQSGTDRCAEAIDTVHNNPFPPLLWGSKFDVVINIQGDEPFIQAEQLTKLMGCFTNESTEIATLVKVIENEDELFNANKPKVVVSNNKEALYFSRHPVPFQRNSPQSEWLQKHFYYKHIGIYAYRYDVLKQITKLPQSPLELAESLEQLRWLENGYRIRVEYTEYESMSVDTQEDLDKILETMTE